MSNQSGPSQGDSPSRPDIFDEVLAEYLRAIESGGNPSRDDLLARYAELASELREFFANHDRMGRLAGPLREPTAVARSRVPGEKIHYFGDYEVLEEIGQGGMGVIYKARQVSLNRVVALKMILAGRLANEQDIQRFHAEAEAAAKLDHPGIVPIFEIGQHGGQHYFSMGFVDGESLAKKVAAGPLSPRRAAELVAQIAETVHYAHERGIIHRDLKPANVLLDQSGQPHVTDFGLAKELRGDSDLTGTGQILGTPSYMPPEQAAGKSDPIGPTADVYALGAILYCLLTGRPPFQAATPVDTLRQVLEQVPVSVSQLNGHVPLDLETIALKCLEKDPRRRYATAAELAAELHRYLDGRPILARPVGFFDRTWRSCQRNPVVAALITTAALCLFVGTVVSSYFAVEASRRATSEAIERGRADDKAAEALREKNAADEQKQIAEQARQAEAAQRQIAEAQRAEAEKMRNQAEANFRQARRAVDDMYTQVAEKWLAHQPQMQPVQREFLLKALQFYAEFAQQTSTDPAVRLETARAYGRVAEIRHNLGDSAQAEHAGQQAIDRLQKLVLEFPKVPEYRQDLADCLHKFGAILGDTGRESEEEKAHRRALALEEKLVADFPVVREYRRDLGRGHSYVGTASRALHRFPDADKAYHLALTIQTRLVAEFLSVPEYRENLAETYLNLAGCPPDQQQLQALHAASAILEKLVAEFPAVPQYRNTLACVYYRLAEVLPSPEDEQILRKALALQEKLAADFPALSNYRYDLMRSLQLRGYYMRISNRAQEAEQALRRATAIGEKLVADSPSVYYFRDRLGRVYTNLVELLRNTGRLPEVEEVFRRSIDLYRRVLLQPRDRPLTGELVAAAKHTVGTQRQALRVFQETIERHPKEPCAWSMRAEFYGALGLWDLAAQDFAECFKLEPNPSIRQCFSHAQLSLYVGDTTSDRHICRLLPSRFNTETDYAGAQNELVRACTLAAAPDADLKWAMRIAEKGVQRSPTAPWNYTALGLACYRAGDYQRAVEHLKQSLKVDPGWLAGDHNFPVLAMAYHRLGLEKEARDSLNSAARLMDQWSDGFFHDPVGSPPLLWWDWMPCFLLYREAKILIDGSPPREDPKLYVARARTLAALGDNERSGAACDKASALSISSQ